MGHKSPFHAKEARHSFPSRQHSTLSAGPRNELIGCCSSNHRLTNPYSLPSLILDIYFLRQWCRWPGVFLGLHTILTVSSLQALNTARPFCRIHLAAPLHLLSSFQMTEYLYLGCCIGDCYRGSSSCVLGNQPGVLLLGCCHIFHFCVAVLFLFMW